MTKRILAVCLALNTLNAVAAKTKNPADYKILIHVIGSRSTVGGNLLYAVIDAKAVQLFEVNASLLEPGNYPAKLKNPDPRTPAYRIVRQYEMLLPDGNVADLDLTCVGPVCASPVPEQ